ncbi:MAG TPA: archaetidylserine decarboxylase [Woeseiaceae bacterium]|jgi:phosphatidylserine decarboxylase|nr:archaetidylserine decarboxylase [Woeseiaceae bacterium]
MAARLFVILQYLLPKYWLTALVYRLARVRRPAVKDFLITRFVLHFDVDVEEVAREVPAGYESLNDFFTRELRDDARPVATAADAVIAPVDGTVSQAGVLTAGRLVQAKGLHYAVEDLLATDIETARSFAGGSFATIYLAPYNYHRVHSAVDGQLEALHYVPGDLFSVNEATVSRVSGLFRRNERLIMHFATPRGPVVQILVGAINVGSISTPWTGEIRPRKSGVVDVLEPNSAPRTVRKGDLLGWFNMGSTVILLFPADACRWRPDLQHGEILRMGQPIGSLT